MFFKSQFFNANICALCGGLFTTIDKRLPLCISALCHYLIYCWLKASLSDITCIMDHVCFFNNFELTA